MKNEVMKPFSKTCHLCGNKVYAGTGTYKLSVCSYYCALVTQIIGLNKEIEELQQQIDNIKNNEDNTIRKLEDKIEFKLKVIDELKKGIKE
jgi:hypothetical protein